MDAALRTVPTDLYSLKIKEEATLSFFLTTALQVSSTQDEFLDAKPG